MLKYHSTYIGFREIPDEISLCINITNCPNHCIGCHSSYLKGDIGNPLTKVELSNLINTNNGITCVCFMGGDNEPHEVKRLAKFVIEHGLKSAWYSGKAELPTDDYLKYFNYIKLGPYEEKFGPLDNPLTNQRLYKTEYSDAKQSSTGKSELQMIDITERFWKND